MQTFYTVKDAKALSNSIIDANPKFKSNSAVVKQLDQLFDELIRKYGDDVEFKMSP